ncbi:hypothetical protein FKM82_030929 [Ascaphus truei]
MCIMSSKSRKKSSRGMPDFFRKKQSSSRPSQYAGSSRDGYETQREHVLTIQPTMKHVIKDLYLRLKMSFQAELQKSITEVRTG